MLLRTGRSVKIMAQPIQSQDTFDMQVSVLIKDPRELYFHPPIEISHPKYWKLRSLPAEKSRMLQIQYSGISNKEIRKALKEFNKDFLQNNSDN